MPRYVSLIKWTDRGVREIRQSMEREQAAAELTERLGGRLVASYTTLGPYDGVAIVDAPDDETFAAATLAIRSKGFVEITPMRALGEEATRSALRKLP